MVLAKSILALLLTSWLTQSVDGHGYLKSPRSRNFVAYEDGIWYGGSSSDQTKESCPHCLNIGGTRASCGITGSRNYDFPKNVFGDSLAWSQQATFREESIIDVEAVLTAHHRGHFVMKVCPLSEKSIPDEACFDSHILEFVSDELYGAPKDVNHPERGYVAPPSDGIYDTSGVYGMLFHHKYKLPKGVTGKVLLQWKYYTGNSCVFPGYDQYPFPAPGWTVPGLGLCASISPDGSNPPPEMFWNCAEIFIQGESEPTTSPTPLPTKSPVVQVPTSLTQSPTEQPSKPSPPTNGNEKKVVAYYASWQYYDRNSLAKPENFDFTKVDRINFAFFQPDKQGNLYGTDSWGDPIVLYGPYNWSPAPGEACYNSWVNPGSKVCNHHQYEKGLIHLVHEAGGEIYPSIGGWTLSSNFPAIAASDSARKNFADNCVELIKDYGFDGIDIDWEYPGYSNHGGTPQDRQNFNLLLDEVRVRLDGLSAETGKRYGLTAALPCGPSHIYNLDVPHISNVLDELLLMSYDLHGAWDPVTGVNAPLYYQGFGDVRMSVDGCVNLWKNNGAPVSKISVGLGFYGRSFKEASALNHGHQGTDLVNWSIDDGLPQYFSIVERAATGSLKTFRHEASKTPYAYFEDGSGFVSYDDERSICEKTEYVMNNNLKGFLIWELSGDLMPDLTTPLLDSVNRKLSNQMYDCSGGSNTTPSPTKKATPSPTKSPVKSPVVVPTNPPLESPTSSPKSCPLNFTGLKATNGCTQFYSCADGYMKPNIDVLLDCPSNTLFDESLQICNWFASVDCKAETSPPVTFPTKSPSKQQTFSPTTSPIKNPTANPVQQPVLAPTQPTSSITCSQGYTGLRPANLCSEYYHCVNGVVTGPLYQCPSGTLFDFEMQYCNWDYLVTCSEKPTFPTMSPTKPTSGISCPPTYTGLKAAESCTKYYHCVNGQVTPKDNPLLPCGAGTLFDESIQNCNWANQVICNI